MFAIKHRYITEQEFKCLFDEYKDKIYSYALTISHSQYIAEEITQEIFMKLWVCRDMLDEVENMDSYIFTIAKNKILNHFRKAANDIKHLKELQQRMASTHNNVEDQITLSDYDKSLKEAITLLSPQRKLVYQLSRSQGLNHQQIATELNLSHNTVKNHLVEALKFIRKHIHITSTAILLFISAFY